ncbi:helix-turn-helix domain-containing protein [Peptoniphilus equinus]
MASFIGVPRPSVSRELANMQREGLITLDRQHIGFNRIDLERSIE